MKNSADQERCYQNIDGTLIPTVDMTKINENGIMA